MSEPSSVTNSCPKCGAALPSEATAGLCPRCLMAEAMAPTNPDSEPATPQKTLLPEELAPHFPQLEILECRGRGGMGVVYKARQKTLNRLVALKLLAPERVRDPQFAERFTREAQALAALNHPNIVTIHDFGQAGGFYYLLMEFVDGVNLRHLLRARKFAPEEALAIVPPICDALQFAHERGIVHRDIKPENLLLDKDGRVKIADFGIAKMLGTAGAGGGIAGEAVAPDHATGSVVGTPGYSAPEQRASPQRVDSRADIYSLGVVFYEMLTGELPGKPIEPPSKKVQIDVRLDEIVLRALEKSPERRYQTAAEVRTDVETIVGKAGVPPAQPGVATSPTKQALLWMFFGERPERQHVNWPFLLFYFSTLGLWLNGIFLAIELVPWLLNVGRTSATPGGVWQKLLWIAACVVGRRAAMVALNWNSNTVGWTAFARARGMTARMILLLLLIAAVAAGVGILVPWVRARYLTAFADVSSLTSIARVAVWIAIFTAVGWFIVRRARRAVSRTLGRDGSPGASDTVTNQGQSAGVSRRNLPLFVERDGRRRLYWPGVLLFCGTIGLAVLGVNLAFALALWLLTAQAFPMFQPRELPWVFMLVAACAVMRLAALRLGASEVARAESARIAKVKVSTGRKVIFSLLAIAVAMALAAGSALVGYALTKWKRAKTPPPAVALTSAPSPLSFGPAITRVMDGGRGKVIEGQGSTNARFVLSVGEKAKFYCGFRNDIRFTAVIERTILGGGFNAIVKDSLGNVLFTLYNNKVGPMRTERGRIVFREGTLAAEPDGSFILGEFRPETGSPLPITVRLETQSSPATEKAPTPQGGAVSNRPTTSGQDDDGGSKSPLFDADMAKDVEKDIQP